MKMKQLLKKYLVKKEIHKVTIPCIEGHFLDDKKALITGGSSGIGYAIAQSFLKNGVSSVVLCGRNQEKLKKAQEQLRRECNCSEEHIQILQFDISDISGMTRILSEFLSHESNGIDVFVNNAGINGGSSFPNTTEEEFDEIIDINLKGMYFISQIMADYMVSHNIQGNILNITSSSALRPANTPYIVSKWGERGLTLGMAKKYLPYGIVVNGLAPGPTMTPMMKEEDHDDLSNDYSPIGRYATPEEMGNLATILVSDMGRLIVGDTIYATGGAGVITYDDASY